MHQLPRAGRRTRIVTFKSGGSTYAAVASRDDDGVQILDITDPSAVTAAGSITDPGTNTDALELNGASGITTFKSGGSTYAAVASFDDDGVQILNITDPSNVTAAGNIEWHRPRAGRRIAASPHSSQATAPTRRSPHTSTRRRPDT